MCLHTCSAVAKGEDPVNVNVTIPLDDEVYGLAWVDVQLAIETRKIILEHDDAGAGILLFAKLDTSDNLLYSW